MQRPALTVSAPSLEIGTPSKSTADVSDKATTAFVRRTLCSQNNTGDLGRVTPRPVEELLPPLTSSNDVDLQLYGFIAIIIKEFVYSWYSKITPDHTFVDEAIRIVAHCTRALEQRLRQVDLESLLLDEIPDLIDAHVTAYRVAHQSADLHPYSAGARQVYHTLNPHPALSPAPVPANPETVREQERNEEAWRHLLVQGVLAVLLPTEDLENRCLHALVTESLAEMILGTGVSGRVCEGWVLWEGITKAIGAAKSRSTDLKEMKRSKRRLGSLGRLERFGLLSSHGADKFPRRASSWTSLSGSVSAWFWIAAQYVFLAFTALRGAIIAFATSSSLPARGAAIAKSPSVEVAHSEIPSFKSESGRQAPESLRPIVSMKAWACFANLIELDDCMPWLSGFIAILYTGVVEGPGRLGYTDGTLDR
ncbi:hypothetical protein P152DRAFT_124872 [Eremomyces bilateralis CBS 781.70]|uniref:PXA domain-containing protein n=1 Tax=Eremomyces bilateralis CBS 781.70 TaxID=1392243 RepID=A0A6G1GEK1_9PEZI|nr:uncharacterized protein P152DRAFT_124872 [Eremomyces bilateralis CBS 781.70]KAF1816454.1 hypothetical protein P152DRAFT_124872 [Eremomyces bilateralis CBS 781.70]